MATELTARDVLSPEYIGVSESDSVLGAVRLMRQERAGCVLVVRGAEAVGIMTEWDILGLIADEDDPAETTVGEAMSSPLLSVPPDHPISDAAELMARENIRNLVVEDDDGITGIITQRDVIAVAGSYGATTAPATELGSTRPEGDTPAPNGGDEYGAGQGVCEVCGTLTESLWETNGQLVCSDCRAV